MQRRLGRRIWLIGVIVALLIAACSSGSGQDPDLTVFGIWTGAEADAFRRVLDDFEDRTGLHVRYTGSSDFITAIRERAEEGAQPDIGVFPQPGLMNALGQEGFVLPLRTDVRDEVEAHVLETVQAATISSRGLNGVPFRVSVKSLVWYSPSLFADLGYEVPDTWEDLKVLSDRIRNDGYEAWCMGISAFDATGWPATDWVEDIVLRDQTPEFYDDWVAGTIPFTDPTIGAAFDTFGSITLGSGVSDRRRTIVNTTPAAAMNPMLADEPGCLMYKQASFQTANLPDGTDIGPDGDVDVFVLPGNYTETPVLIGGDVAAAMTNRNETWELLAYLASPESAAVWADLGGFVAAQDDLDDTIYHDEFDARMSQILKDADVVRFDGSDQMYAPVGTDSFFDAMTVYIASGRTELAQEVAQAGYDR